MTAIGDGRGTRLVDPSPSVRRESQKPNEHRDRDGGYRVHLPPDVLGAPVMRVRDFARVLWWIELGFEYGALHGRRDRRLLSFVFAVLWWVFLPIVSLMAFIRFARPWVKYYMTPERDVVLAVAVHRWGWSVEDYGSAKPGTKRGGDLLAILQPTLLLTADEEVIEIRATAANEALAAKYMDAVPGLVDIGRGWPRGRRLRREPGGGHR